MNKEPVTDITDNQDIFISPTLSTSESESIFDSQQDLFDSPPKIPRIQPSADSGQSSSQQSTPPQYCPFELLERYQELPSFSQQSTQPPGDLFSLSSDSEAGCPVSLLLVVCLSDLIVSI